MVDSHPLYWLETVKFIIRKTEGKREGKGNMGEEREREGRVKRKEGER